MNDAIEITERLAPHLAWPLVALLALPFLLWRLGAVAELVRILSAEDTKAFFADFSSIGEKSNQILAGMQTTHRQLGEVGVQLSVLRDINAQLVDVQKDSIAFHSEEIIQIAPLHNLDEIGDDLATTEMLMRMKTAWEQLSSTLDHALQKQGHNLNSNKFTLGASILANPRHATHLRKEDARLIGKLHSQYRRFERLERDKEEWLTPKVYISFMSGVKRAGETIRKIAA